MYNAPWEEMAELLAMLHLCCWVQKIFTCLM